MDPMSRFEEKQWIEKARRGDLEAFSALVHLHREKAIYTAYFILGNWEDARDAAQEAFVKAWNHIFSFKGGSLFSTWFYRILINACKDEIRKKKTRFLFFKTENEGENVAADTLEQIPSSSESALNLILNQETKTVVLNSIQKLPLGQRTVFSLRYLESLSLEEIAEVENLSVGAVKAHLWQGGQKVKKDLAAYLENRREVRLK